MSVDSPITEAPSAGHAVLTVTSLPAKPLPEYTEETLKSVQKYCICNSQRSG